MDTTTAPATHRRILFVDDDEDALNGIKNLLHRQRHAWEMTFALGGDAALEILQQAPFDVIVSDMRMPGMDGATLLERVKEQHPRVARIILSGQADRQAVMRVLPHAHQFLSKPCDPDALRALVERTCKLTEFLDVDALKRIVGRLGSLPSAPQIYLELCQAANQPDIGLAAIANIVERDPAMSAKMLQLVNSAYFGLSRRMTSIQQAVNYLGLELVKNLALSAHVFATIDTRSERGFSLDALQKHSLLTARLAKRIVADPALADDTFTAGMLHDIGKIVLWLAVPVPCAEVARLAERQQRTAADVEQELLAVTHAEVGAYLLGVWGLPFGIIEAVAFHHRPALASESPPAVLVAVHVADAFVNHSAELLAGAAMDDYLDMAFLESSGFAHALPQWHAEARAELAALEV